MSLGRGGRSLRTRLCWKFCLQKYWQSFKQTLRRSCLTLLLRQLFAHHLQSASLRISSMSSQTFVLDGFLTPAMNLHNTYEYTRHLHVSCLLLPTYPPLSNTPLPPPNSRLIHPLSDSHP